MERVCHVMLLSVKFHLDGQGQILSDGLGWCLKQLPRVRGHPSPLIPESPLPATHMQRVHCTGLKLTVISSIYNHSQKKRLRRNKQTVEAGKDQRKPQLGNTQQAQLMTEKRSQIRALSGERGQDAEGRRTRLRQISRELSCPVASWFSSFRPVS